jgi:hypothetical protein
MVSIHSGVIHEVYNYISGVEESSCYGKDEGSKISTLIERVKGVPNMRYIGDSRKANKTIARYVAYPTIVALVLYAAISMIRHIGSFPRLLSGVEVWILIACLCLVGLFTLGFDFEEAYGEPTVDIHGDVSIFRTHMNIISAVLWKSDVPPITVMTKRPLSRLFLKLLGKDYEHHSFLYVGDTFVGMFSDVDQVISDVNGMLYNPIA